MTVSPTTKLFKTFAGDHRITPGKCHYVVCHELNFKFFFLFETFLCSWQMPNVAADASFLILTKPVYRSLTLMRSCLSKLKTWCMKTKCDFWSSTFVKPLQCGMFWAWFIEVCLEIEGWVVFVSPHQCLHLLMNHSQMPAITSGFRSFKLNL